ncbi:hypothetical protein BHE97_05540 [Aeromicrobium sp. PE09-221]|uniref:GNAT family N-acetyltransferase n=1 Tax=Aeromicrobium sp. PE09-221 TaxID=1898043 RepID=UPI000B3E8CE3|nr:GNAT family N-acetyltransferase [Aeromicrobium sp. PE09-221]OUZ11298.1 hypothetical protein BHE97_05540 [Aeromicrobium sp. PE09-221]
MPTQIRPITPDDHEQLKVLLTEAFGTSDGDWAGLAAQGQSWWGAFVDGHLAATINHREYTSWFRGVEVPTAGITGVSIAAEYRGRQLLRPLMEELTSHARSRDERIATLFATATGIYRGFGFSRILQVGSVELPVASLARVRGTLDLRRAGDDDAEVLHGLYEQWARRHDGPLTRRGPAHERPDHRFKDLTGTTIVEDAGEPRGYLRWKRGTAGDWADSVIEVPELVALDAEAMRTALTSLASYDSVASRVRLFSPGDVDTVRWLLPSNAWTPLADTEPYMLRVLDPSAFDLLPAPPGVTATLPFLVGDDGWVLHVDEGTMRIESDPAAATGMGRRLEPGALAVSFAGALASSAQREVGLLSGDDRDDTLWDILFTSGRRLATRDSF